MSDPPRLRWKGSALVLTVASVILLTTAMAVPRYAGASAQIFVIVVGALVIRLLVQAVRVATSAPGPFPFDQALHQPPEPEIPCGRCSKHHWNTNAVEAVGFTASSRWLSEERATPPVSI